MVCCCRIVSIHGFNPRLPGGRRLKTAGNPAQLMLFQSTPSGGKATWVNDVMPHLSGVSIHAFRGEGDEPRPPALSIADEFQSTPSGGKATVSQCVSVQTG